MSEYEYHCKHMIRAVKCPECAPPKSGFKKGEKLLYLTMFGGQPHLEFVTFKDEGPTGCGYDGVYVEEDDCYRLHCDLYSKEQILAMFEE